MRHFNAKQLPALIVVYARVTIWAECEAAFEWSGRPDSQQSVTRAQQVFDIKCPFPFLQAFITAVYHSCLTTIFSTIRVLRRRDQPCSFRCFATTASPGTIVWRPETKDDE